MFPVKEESLYQESYRDQMISLIDELVEEEHIKEDLFIHNFTFHENDIKIINRQQTE